MEEEARFAEKSKKLEDMLKNGVPTAEITKRIENTLKSGIPAGSTRAQVEAWLQSSKMEVWYTDSKGLSGDEYSDFLNKIGYRAADLGGVISSYAGETLGPPEFDLPFGIFAQIVFLFNKEDDLIDTVVNILSPETTPIPGKPTVSEMEGAIKESLLLGSTHLQVEAWLKSQTIEHSPFMDEKKRGQGFDIIVRQGGHEPSDVGGIITAIIREIAEGSMGYENMQIVFFFDKKGELIDSKIESMSTFEL